MRQRARMPTPSEWRGARGGPAESGAAPFLGKRPRSGLVLGGVSLAGSDTAAAGDVDLRPVDQPAPEVAEAAGERDAAAGEDADPERVAGARVGHRDVGDALLVEQPPELEVDLARGQLGGVEHGARAVDLGGA